MKLYAQGFILQPRDFLSQFRVSGRNEVIVFGACAHLDDNFILGDGYLSGVSCQIPKEGPGLGFFIAVSDSGPQESIEHAGHNGQLHINIDAHGHGRAQGIHVKEVNGIADEIFDDHAAGIAINELVGGAFHLIGDEHGRLVVAQVFDKQLSQRLGIGTQFDGFVDHAWGAVGPANVGEADLGPCGLVQGMDALD